MEDCPKGMLGILKHCDFDVMALLEAAFDLLGHHLERTG